MVRREPDPPQSAVYHSTPARLFCIAKPVSRELCNGSRYKTFPDRRVLYVPDQCYNRPALRAPPKKLSEEGVLTACLSPIGLSWAADWLRLLTEPLPPARYC